MLDSREDIEKELSHDFFKNILHEPMEDRAKAIGKIAKHIPKVITPVQKYSNFIKPITMQEVESIIQEIPVGKALGPDGFKATLVND